MHQPFEKRDPHLLNIGDVIYYNARQDGAPEPTKNQYFVVMALPTRLSDECYTFLPITHSQKDKSIFSKFNVPLSSISQKFQENLNKKSKRYGPSYFEIPLKYPYDLHPNPKAYPPKPSSRPKEKEDNDSPDT